jgi:hypothetical protein
MPDLDPQRIALGIQQPWAELILRGQKTLEIRSQSTQVRGRIYLYASRRSSSLPAAQNMVDQHNLTLDTLPRGLLVGSVELVESRLAVPADAGSACLPAELLVRQYAWHFAAPERLASPVPVRFLPYGVWFYPFRRKNQDRR